MWRRSPSCGWDPYTFDGVLVDRSRARRCHYLLVRDINWATIFISPPLTCLAYLRIPPPGIAERSLAASYFSFYGGL